MNRISLICAFLFALIFAWGSNALAQLPSGEAEIIQPYYTVEGEVLKAGRFPLTKNVRIKNAIAAAGGLTKDADRSQAEIIRFNKRQKVYYTIYFQVENALSGDLTDNLILLDQDRIIIHNVREKAARERVLEEKVKAHDVFIAGAIARPGAYPFTESMTVRDLVGQSGGTLKTSYPEQAEILPLASGADKSRSTDRKIINLKKALDGNPAHNVPLRPNDRLVVKDQLDEGRILPEVCLSGEILLPGRYPITKEERLSSVIGRAGGYRPGAQLQAAVFSREQVRKLQQRSLEQMAARIERELQQRNPAAIGKSGNAGDDRDEKTNEELKLKMLQQIKTLRVTGRVLITTIDADKQKRGLQDVELEDGDNLDIPPISDTVRVMGEVKAEGSYDFRSRLSYQDYITAAGGYAKSADNSAVFVIKADGSIRKPAAAFFAWNNKRNRLEIGGSGRANQIIEKGDTIVVPEQITKPAWLKNIHHIVLTLINNGIIPPNEMK